MDNGNGSLFSVGIDITDLAYQRLLSLILVVCIFWAASGFIKK